LVFCIEYLLVVSPDLTRSVSVSIESGIPEKVIVKALPVSDNEGELICCAFSNAGSSKIRRKKFLQ